MLPDIEIAGIAAHRTARVASIELGESLMPKPRPADARHGGATVEAETVPAWVASSEKVGDTSRRPIDRVIQITQAMLDDRSAEDAATCKMRPYRSQTPLQMPDSKPARRKAGVTSVI